MQNISRVKNELKSVNKKEQFKLLPFFSINFQNMNNSLLNIKTSKLTKNQYLTSDFVSFKKKEEIKFPLETTVYTSLEQLIQVINKQKRDILSFIKITNVLILEKKWIKTCNFSILKLYYKINNLTLRTIKFTHIIQYFKKTPICS